MDTKKSKFLWKKKAECAQSDLTGLAPLRDFQHQEGAGDSIPRKGNWMSL